MARALQTLHRGAVVGPDGRIELRVPELSPGQHVHILIEAEIAEDVAPAIDVLATLPGHRLLRTAQEADAYIRAEREAWER